MARLSVVYLTICILHCDKDFYKHTRKLAFNVEPIITFFLKFLVSCIHSNALHHFRLDFFMDIFFLEDIVTEKQPNLGPYCL